MTKPYETADDVRARVCGDKRAHAVNADARKHADELNAKHGDHAAPYRCPFCHRWHVGHTPGLPSMEAIARVIRGLDPAPPEPHDPPAKPDRRQRRKNRAK